MTLISAYPYKKISSIVFGLLLPVMTEAAPVQDNLSTLAKEFEDPTTQYLVAKKYYIGNEYPKDKKTAAKWFKKAADAGHTKAQWYLGHMYFKGDGVSRNPPLALKYLEMAAASGHDDARYDLALFYLSTDKNKAADYKNGLRWLTEAAEQDHAEAAFLLGKMIAEGKGVDKNPGKAKKWLTIAVELGHDQASAYLSNLTDEDSRFATSSKQNSDSKEQNSGKQLNTNSPRSSQTMEGTFRISRDERHELDKVAKTSLINQAINGNVDAQYNIGMKLLASKQHRHLAAKWLRNASNQDHAGALYQLGILYRDGISVQASEAEAIKLFRLAASWGVTEAQHALDKLLRKQLISSGNMMESNEKLASPDAQYTLGLRYANGDGVERDAATAMEWMLKAAQQDHRDAQYYLGKTYKSADMTKAKFWLAKAAENGSRKANSALQEILYAEERKLIQEQVEILKNAPIASNSPGISLLQDAKNGRPEAQFKLGLLYIEGDDNNLKQDTKAGLLWLERAAEDHYTRAQIALADLYYSGKRVKKDYSRALHWYQEAAQSGSADAQFNLGNMYQRGLGVKRHIGKAQEWYRKAAQQGHERARNKLGGCRIC